MELHINRYWIETYGCQMNKAESEALENQLKMAGWQPALVQTDAELIILNTCSVRKTAENRIWGRIGFYKHEKLTRNIKLAIIGCMGERLKENLIKENDAVDIVVGNFEKNKFLEAVESAFAGQNKVLFIKNSEYKFNSFHNSGNSIKSFIPIMHGCNNFCSYCIVPYVRGREVSRDPYDILNEISKLEEKDVKEITLLGQNVNSYKYTLNNRVIDFPELLLFLIDNIKKIQWIRFLTSNPKDLSPKLIEVIKNNKVLCNHIHLPVQHGSNTILKAMKRKYTREKYMSIVEQLKNKISDVSITTDILIGFPGESHEDFVNTVELVKEVRFNDAFTYRYNPREGTEAFDFEDDVSEVVKLERLSEIIELQRTISSEIKRQKIGKTVPVLVESVSKKNRDELLCRTERDEMVVFPGYNDLIGKIVDINLVSLNGNTFVGKEIKERICPGR